MLFDFFTWWLRQLRSLWPARFHRAAPDAVIVAIDRLEDDPVTATGSILLRRAGLETFAASLDLARPRAGALPALATGLRLPDEMVLHREVTLPLAAERDLAAVLGFEMDRLTPFDAGEVFWGVSRLRRDAERGMLLLTLLVVLRRPVEALADALGRVDLRPAFLESAAGRIELGAPARAGGGRWALYGVCAALALACLAIPVIRQQQALDSAQARIAALMPAAREAMALRDKLAIAASGQQAIAAAQADGDALDILAALTTALPDGTWLGDLTLREGDLTIDGQSADAARLISVLAAAPQFHDPKFIAPVTRALDGNSDLFSIHATVTP